MKLFQQILTSNDCYLAGRTITPKGVMVHSTGSNNPNLSRYVPGNSIIGVNEYNNHWNQSGTTACVHAFIGKLADGSIGTVQTLPWYWRGWHCGKGTSGKSANDTHIAFEICEDSLSDRNYFNKVYKEAVSLTAYLCNAYKLNPLADGVVICHSEGYSRGVASNHGDVMHWFPKFGKSMNTFRADVAQALEEMNDLTEEQVRKIVQDEYQKLVTQQAKLPVSDWAEELLEEAKNLAITDGTRPQSSATRQEVALMVLAAINKMRGDES